MIARWRLDEGNKRAKKRAKGVFGMWCSAAHKFWWVERVMESYKIHLKIYRKTTKRCSCYACSGHDRPKPSDIRQMPLEV